MGRCIWCHSVVTKDEDFCYVCGDNVSKDGKVQVKRRPLSTLTNLVFIASLAFTAYCFFAVHKLSLPVTLTISLALLMVRIVAEQLATKKPS
jgi:hypothetical protein